MLGKHTKEEIKIQQLENIIQRKDKEIKDIKFSLADILLMIKDLNDANDYGDSSVKKRKISELCMEIRYQLLIDESEDNYEKAKIIELPNTRKSNK
ncbi:MAG: hypothetical protein HFJ53_02000 [Clostridia bacterium]|jgi:hypothetical protein|nr:hypothetical protein [Clostridia bacterium]